MVQTFLEDLPLARSTRTFMVPNGWSTVAIVLFDGRWSNRGLFRSVEKATHMSAYFSLKGVHPT